ncbi:hypothetical protein B0T26DRAFT_741340 [Lasiosphaeria miniovina]|uniref:Uncharacterized protein n=1 Tax=Lasiosphaeria miniovina TaxID=1954250 RepID=A0AA40AM49_9PEZI|nr:uncharacterized protein B0T26DRAFT_741340 [Lasiosphaeria miniovina]KAK0718329.1 hypothetical protein B0T26DRAFT_741340 [Lasiosphaeria miniovina]
MPRPGEFESVPGYFVDYAALAAQDPTLKITTQPGLGLLDERFTTYVDALNARNPTGTTSYKADAKLIPKGVVQAADLARFWAAGIAEAGIPHLSTLYTSPLTRYLETTRLVFSNIFAAAAAASYTPAGAKAASASISSPPFRPIVKELLREHITDHTYYRHYVIKDGFKGEDAAFDNIFATNACRFLSLTIHSYAIAAILEAVGSPVFKLPKGSSMVVLVKATRLEG